MHVSFLNIWKIYVYLLLCRFAISYKILVYSPKFAVSHMNFMGQIADTLVEAGHDITVLQPIYFEQIPITGVEKARIIHVGPDSRAKELTETALTIEDVKKMWTFSSYSPGAVLWSVDFVSRSTQFTCEMLLDDRKLISDLNKENFDMAITELFDYSGIGLIHAVGIGNILGVHTINLVEHTALHVGVPVVPSYVPSSHAFTGVDSSILNRVQNLLMTFVSLYFQNRISQSIQTCLDEKLGMNTAIMQEILGNITWILTNTDPLFDFPKPILPTLVELGGIGVKKSRPLDEKWNAILSIRETNVLISFGSVAKATLMPDNFKASFVELFETFSNTTFLWKYEEPEKDTFVKHLDNVVLSNWLPQNDLLGDSRLSLFITHGGAGSVFESAINAIPLVVIPIFGDQMRNAKLVVHHDFGVEYPKHQIPNSKQFIEVVREALSNEKYKQNARYASEILRSQPLSPKEKLIKTIELAGKFGASEKLRNPGRKLSYVQYYNLDILAIIFAFSVSSIWMLMKFIRFLLRIFMILGNDKSKIE